MGCVPAIGASKSRYVGLERCRDLEFFCYSIRTSHAGAKTNTQL